MGAHVCVCVYPVIIIPIKSRFLNPAAQADTLNKIILIPHGKRNENEEINMEEQREGSHTSLLSFSFPPFSASAIPSDRFRCCRLCGH